MWRGLQAARFLPKTSGIGSTDYSYWRNQLHDLDNKHLRAGLELSGTFHGYLTWSEFRKLCVDGYALWTQQSRQAEAPATARLTDMRTFSKNPRFHQLLAITHAMRREEGEGPITKASRAGDLDKRFLQGKSPEEVIAFCHRKYGSAA